MAEKREKRKLDRVDLAQMRLPKDLWMARFDQISEKSKPPIFNYVSKIEDAMERGVGLFLTGAIGVGKSSIAAVIAKEARARGYPVYFTSLWQLRDDIRDQVEYNDTQSILDRCREVPMLILDNLRREDADEKYFLPLRTIEELLSHRRARQQVTILTTRLDLATLRTHMRGVVEATEGSMLSLTVEGVNRRLQDNAALAKEFFGK